MVGIYKITSPSGRIYIGQTVNIYSRIHNYEKLESKVKGQTRLYNSLLKYGFDNHKFEFIEECNEKDLNYWERYYQDKYNVIGKNGLNCRLTKCDDRSGRLSEETKLKISNSLTGKTMSEENKQKLIIRNTGCIFSIERKNKIREKAIGRKPSEETKAKMKLNSGFAKKVLKISTGEIFSSVYEAADLNSISRHTMRNWVLGLRNKGKADYKYVDENE